MDISRLLNFYNAIMCFIKGSRTIRDSLDVFWASCVRAIFFQTENLCSPINETFKTRTKKAQRIFHHWTNLINYMFYRHSGFWRNTNKPHQEPNPTNPIIPTRPLSPAMPVLYYILCIICFIFLHYISFVYRYLLYCICFIA